MKRFPLIFVAALLGAAVSMPAQFAKQGRALRDRTGVAVKHQLNQGDVRHKNVRSRRTQRGHSRRAPAPVRQVSRTVRRVGRAIERSTHRVGRGGRGYWETRHERVLVPGYWDRQFVPARYGWVYDSCGRRSWGIVCDAHYDRVWIPARWESRPRRVWVDGRRGCRTNGRYR